METFDFGGGEWSGEGLEDREKLSELYRLLTGEEAQPWQDSEALCELCEEAYRERLRINWEILEAHGLKRTGHPLWGLVWAASQPGAASLGVLIAVAALFDKSLMEAENQGLVRFIRK